MHESEMTSSIQIALLVEGWGCSSVDWIVLCRGDSHSSRNIRCTPVTVIARNAHRRYSKSPSQIDGELEAYIPEFHHQQDSQPPWRYLSFSCELLPVLATFNDLRLLSVLVLVNIYFYHWFLAHLQWTVGKRRRNIEIFPRHMYS